MIEPHGLLDVGDGQQVAWQVCGNREGKPAVVLHGGPGAGSGPLYLRLFDPARYRIVLFDQRGCGRSTPHAGDPGTDLASNTTAHLVGDIERLRVHLGVDRWLVLGLSWGSTLGLAYAQEHPERVSEMVLGMVVTGTSREVRWITRDMGRLFPQEWRRFRHGVPAAARDGDLAAAYSRLLENPDPEVREQAARKWCDWEDTHVAFAHPPAPRPEFADPRYRLAFARLVTHYWANRCFLADGHLLEHMDALAATPGVLVHGRRDVSSPLDVPWELQRRWSGSELVVVDDAAHSTRHGMGAALLAATDRFAGHPR